VIVVSRITDEFGLGVTQSQVDFIDVYVETDMPLFVDPFAFSRRRDTWSKDCHLLVVDFFQNVVDVIRRGDRDRALELLNGLREPNETHLGFSKHRPRGSGLGRQTSINLYDALASSTAMRTGFISSLEESELMVEGISKDRISDLTTNIIRDMLVEYTQQQCLIWSIRLHDDVNVGHVYDRDAQSWHSVYRRVPILCRRPLLLVPKWAVRYDLAYDSDKYYSQFVLDYLESEEIRKGSHLVRTLRTGRRRGTRYVTKKELKAAYPKCKHLLYEVSKEHPELLERYRESLGALIGIEDAQTPFNEDVEQNVARMLADVMDTIPTGAEQAANYHKYMCGTLEFLFYPALIHPQIEAEIHDGRKRIDIVMENNATSGVFAGIPRNARIPAGHIVIECKNYTEEIGNRELDQLSGRFSRERGQVGISCSRNMWAQDQIYKKCTDTFSDGRGLILPIDDRDVKEMLSRIANGNRPQVDDWMWQVFTRVSGYSGRS
jgi:hypothetical protein